MNAVPNPLVRLIYISAASAVLSGQELATLLAAARRHNAARGITGVLVSCGIEFFQVLEGAPQDVLPLYQRICADPRHNSVVTVLQERVTERIFAGWSMAHADLDPANLQAACAIQRLTDLNPGLHAAEGQLAGALLDAFLRQTRRRVAETPPAEPCAQPS